MPVKTLYVRGMTVNTVGTPPTEFRTIKLYLYYVYSAKWKFWIKSSQRKIPHLVFTFPTSQFFTLNTETFHKIFKYLLCYTESRVVKNRVGHAVAPSAPRRPAPSHTINIRNKRAARRAPPRMLYYTVIKYIQLYTLYANVYTFRVKRF